MFKGVFPQDLKGVIKNISRVLSPLTSVTLSIFIADGTARSIPFSPSRSPYPESSPKNVTLAASLPSATPEIIKEHPISMRKKTMKVEGPGYLK